MRAAVRLLALAAALGLAGCAGLGPQANQILSQVAPGVVPPAVPQGIERGARLRAAGAPLLQVGQVRTGSTGVVPRESLQNGVETFVTADGSTIGFRDRMMVSFKGFGVALMGADVRQPARLVRGMRPGVSDRFHSYLTGNDEIVTRTYRCIVEDRGPREVTVGETLRPTRLMAEMCRSLTDEFTNLYWVVPGTGEIIQTRQWIDPNLGELSTRIVPE